VSEILTSFTKIDSSAAYLNSSFNFSSPNYFEPVELNFFIQNSIQEEIKSRLKLENVCCYSVQNLLPSSLLSKHLKNKIYKTIILLVVMYGCKTWSPTVGEELG
jgi:hypothetical protein